MDCLTIVSTTNEETNAPKFVIGSQDEFTESSSDEQIPSTSIITCKFFIQFKNIFLALTPTYLSKHQRKCSSDDGIHYVDDDDGVEFSLDSRHLNKVHEAQIATARFKKANSLLQNAKQQIKQTQEALNKKKILDSEALELLNRHIQEVNDAEQERLVAEEFHRTISNKMLILAHKIKQMEKENSKAIKKSRVYFEMRMEFNLVMDHQKKMISRLETEVKQKKRDYNTSLSNLEKISNSIHEERSLSSLKRTSENTTSNESNA